MELNCFFSQVDKFQSQSNGSINQYLCISTKVKFIWNLWLVDLPSRSYQEIFLEFWLDMNFVKFLAGFVQLIQITKLRRFMHLMELVQLMDFMQLMHIIIPHETNATNTNATNTNAGSYQCP